MWSIPKLPPLPLGERIALCGPMASGKTFLAKYLSEFHNYEIHTFASKLKSIAYELYGVNGKNGDNRRILQDLGDDLRKYDNDVFSKYTLWGINKRNPLGRVVIDDLRLPAEATLLKEAGFRIIAVTTPSEIRFARIRKMYPDIAEGTISHETEVAWQDIHADAEIDSSDPMAILDLDRILTGWASGR